MRLAIAQGIAPNIRASGLSNPPDRMIEDVSRMPHKIWMPELTTPCFVVRRFDRGEHRYGWVVVAIAFNAVLILRRNFGEEARNRFRYGVF